MRDRQDARLTGANNCSASSGCGNVVIAQNT